MVMTITVPQNGYIGPGILNSATSTFVGPLALGSGFRITATGPVGGSEQTAWTQFIPTQLKTVTFRPFDLSVPFVANPLSHTNPGQQLGFNHPVEGESTHLQVNLEDPFQTILDSDTITAPWSPTAGLDVLIQQMAGSGVNANATLNSQITGLIDTTLPSLQTVIDSILTGITATITTVGGAVGYPLGLLLSGHLLDLITTISLTSGTTCDPVDHDISGGVYFGLQIGIDSYPSFMQLTGLDSAYSPAAFAILTLTRGGYVVLRRPIHTLTDTIYPLPGAPVFALELDLPVLPLGYHVHVDWAEGVCGHVLALKLP